jgi:hypothetical protein
MSVNISNSVDDLLDQLQIASQVNKNINKNADFKLNKDDLQEFLLQYSGRLIKGSVDLVADVTQYITNAPDAKDVESLSKLVGASAAAIETLNKIYISNEKNKSSKEIKQMDIESRKQLNGDENRVALYANREELLKQLISDAKIIDMEPAT